MDNEKFWLVWQPQSGNPTYCHNTYQSAQREAERLAESAPSREFYVLEAISKSAKVSVQTTFLSDDSALPF